MANNYPITPDLQDVAIPGGQLVDVSAASVSYVPIPFAGVIVDAWAAIAAATTSADSIVTVKVSKAGATAITIGTITIVQSTSAIGKTYQMAITGTESARSVMPGDAIFFDSDGAGSTTSIANFVAVLRRT